MLHVKFFFYHRALLCHSILLGKTTLTLFTPLGGADFIYLYIYIHIHFKNPFYHPSCLSHSKLEKMPFDHSFLSGGSDFSVFFKSFFYHFSSSYQSILLGGVDVACQFFFFHAALLCYSMLLGKTILPLFTPLGGG